MPLNEFWFGDMRLFEAYKKAYLRNISYTAWYQGNYNRIACEIGAINSMVKKKDDRIKDWVEYQDPTEVKEKRVITTENLEEEFRREQVLLNSWLGWNKAKK